MSKLKTKTEHGIDGEIEYQAVECYHCGYDTPVDDATHALIATKIRDSTYYQRDYLKLYYQSEGTDRMYCSDCAKSIFGDVPEGNYQRRLDEFMREGELQFLLITILHMVMGLLAFIALVAIVNEVFHL